MTKAKAQQPDRQLFEQLRLAAQQIDDPAKGGRLAWLVAFARQDPAQWLAGDVEAHGHRLLAFAGFGGAGWMAPGAAALSRSEVLALHEEVRDKLRDLVRATAGTVINIPSEGLETALVRVSSVGAKPAIFGFSRGGPFRTMFWQAVAALISNSDRLISCPTCNEPFFYLRKQKFCEPKCAERWHDRRKIEAKKKGVAR